MAKVIVATKPGLVHDAVLTVSSCTVAHTQFFLKVIMILGTACLSIFSHLPKSLCSEPRVEGDSERADITSTENSSNLL